VAVAPSGIVQFVWHRNDGSSDFCCLRAQTRRRTSSGLGPVQDLSAAGPRAADPQVALDASDNAYFIWRRLDGSSDLCCDRVQTRMRSAGGSLSAVQDLSAAGQDAFSQQVGVDPDGNAYFVWSRSDGTDVRAQMRRRASDGTLGGVQNLSASGGGASLPQVAVAPNGTAHFVWLRFDGSTATCCRIVQTRRRTSSGLGVVQDLTTSRVANGPQVAVDPNDNASFVWEVAGVIQTRRRTANGTFDATVNLSN
jgi:hypothetical protein